MLITEIVAITCLVALMPIVMEGCANKSTAPENGQFNIPEVNTLPQLGDNLVNPDSLQVPILTRLDPDPRIAVREECFYALDPGHGGRSSKSINGWTVSDWNYMNTDPNAYNWIKARMSQYCSCWYISSDASYIRNYWSGYGYGVKPVSFYQNLSGYGYYPNNQNGYGRGMQCRSFVRLILYRSGVYQSTWFPSYAEAINDYNRGAGYRTYTKPFSQLRVGDVIQTSWANGHTAIVVQILAGVEGQSVTSIDVVDANYVGGDGNEIIARHIISRIASGQPGNGGVGDLDSYIGIDLIALGGR